MQNDVRLYVAETVTPSNQFLFENNIDTANDIRYLKLNTDYNELIVSSEITLEDSQFKYNDLYNYAFTKTYSFVIDLNDNNVKVLNYYQNKRYIYDAKMVINNEITIDGTLYVLKDNKNNLECSFVELNGFLKSLLTKKINSFFWYYAFRLATNSEKLVVTLDDLMNYNDEEPREEVLNFYNYLFSQGIQIFSQPIYSRFIEGIGLYDAYSVISNDSVVSPFSYQTSILNEQNKSNAVNYRNFALVFNAYEFLKILIYNYSLDITNFILPNNVVKLLDQPENIDRVKCFIADERFNFKYIPKYVEIGITNDTSTSTECTVELNEKSTVDAFDTKFSKKEYVSYVDDTGSDIYHIYNTQITSTFIADQTAKFYIYNSSATFNVLATGATYEATLNIYDQNNDIRLTTGITTSDQYFVNEGEVIELIFDIKGYKGIDVVGPVFNYSFDVNFKAGLELTINELFEQAPELDITIADLIKFISDSTFTITSFDGLTINFSDRVPTSKLIELHSIANAESYDEFINTNTFYNINVGDTINDFKTNINNEIDALNISGYDESNVQTVPTEIIIDDLLEVQFTRIAETGSTVINNEFNQLTGTTVTGITLATVRTTGETSRLEEASSDTYISEEDYITAFIDGVGAGKKFTEIQGVYREFNGVKYYYDLNPNYSEIFYNTIGALNVVKASINNDEYLRVDVPITNVLYKAPLSPPADVIYLKFAFGDRTISYTGSQGDRNQTFYVQLGITQVPNNSTNRTTFINDIVTAINNFALTSSNYRINGQEWQLPFNAVAYSDHFIIKRLDKYTATSFTGSTAAFSNNISMGFDFEVILNNSSTILLDPAVAEARANFKITDVFDASAKVLKSFDWPLPIYDANTANLFDSTFVGTDSYDGTQLLGSSSYKPFLTIYDDNILNIKIYNPDITDVWVNPYRYYFLNYETEPVLANIIDNRKSQYKDVTYSNYFFDIIPQSAYETSVNRLLKFIPKLPSFKNTELPQNAKLFTCLNVALYNRSESNVWVNINNSNKLLKTNLIKSYRRYIINKQFEDYTTGNLNVFKFYEQPLYGQYYMLLNQKQFNNSALSTFQVYMSVNDYKQLKNRSNIVKIDHDDYIIASIRYNLNTSVAEIKGYKTNLTNFYNV